MFAWFRNGLAIIAVALTAAGCMTGFIVPGGGTSTLVADVAAKATDVANQVGGANGFGGTLMNGYAGHMPGHMGFQTAADLATDASSMMVLLRNDSDQDGTFHLAYMSSHMGLVQQMMDVDVPAGSETTVTIPCSEIVGMGTLDMPGSVGCHLADGQDVDNRMAVPAFLGTDFTCQGTYQCVLTPDVNDLDADGDTTELIIESDAMRLHMTNGGPTGHMHGTGPGMMGSHMGF